MKRNLLIVSAALALFFASRAQAQLYVVQSGLLPSSGSVTAYSVITPGVLTPGFTPITGLNVPLGVAVADKILYVANQDSGTVGAYRASSGAVVQASFISGLKKPIGLVVAGNTLYVSDASAGTVTAYDANSGAPVSGFTPITNLNRPAGLAIAGNTLFVASLGTTFGAGMVGAYDTKGGTLNATLIPGLNGPSGLVATGGVLYVSSNGAVLKYDVNATATTATLDPTFTTITGLDGPTGVVLTSNGNGLFVSSAFGGTIGEYNAKTGGTAINPSFISGLTTPTGLAVKSAK
jgi:hypothetical protein